MGISLKVKMDRDETKMKDLTCMSYTSRGTSEVVVAGQSPGLFRVNVDRGSIVNEVLEPVEIGMILY
jgi:hypothetical protein